MERDINKKVKHYSSKNIEKSLDNGISHAIKLNKFLFDLIAFIRYKFI